MVYIFIYFMNTLLFIKFCTKCSIILCQLEESEPVIFEMAPREREELEQFERRAAPVEAKTQEDEEASLGYTRAVKPKEIQDSEETAYVIQKAKVISCIILIIII